MTEWVVVLSRSQARIFGRPNLKEKIKPLKTIENPLGRERNRAMRLDRPTFKVSAEDEPHEEAAVQFVRKVVDFLNAADKRGEYERLTIAADPHLTGLVKKTWGVGELREPLLPEYGRSIHWIGKNFSKLSDFEVAKEFAPENGSDPRPAPLDVTADLEAEVKVPFKLSFRDTPVSNAVWLDVQQRVEKLARFNFRIISCEVIISSPHNHRQKGHCFHVEVRLHIPGDDIFINREPERDDTHADVFVAVKDAFKALERRLSNHRRRVKGLVKNHSKQVVMRESRHLSEQPADLLI